MEGTLYMPNFISSSYILFEYLKTNINWDKRMTYKKTASYGKAYSYSQTQYPAKNFTPLMLALIERITGIVHFTPNNCLLHYHPSGNSKRNFHAHQTNFLEKDSGIIIILLGDERTLHFSNRNKEITQDFNLVSGSLFYISQETQLQWQITLSEKNTEKDSMSLVFRKLI